VKTDSPSQKGFELPASAKLSFHQLHELNSMSAEENEQHDTGVYTEVIDSLSHVYGKLASGNTNPHLALEWANMLPKRFFCLLKEHRTLALLVLGHYSVVLDCFKHFWWLNGWSSGLLKVIWHEVGAINKYSLAWPMEIVGLSALDM
jgi:hypothetical protein